MAFQGYTQETVDFLWGIRFNNERGWFMEHKQDYQEHLLAPTRALAEQVYDAIHEMCPDDPFLLKLSRIYRDARRLHGPVVLHPHRRSGLDGPPHLLF